MTTSTATTLDIGTMIMGLAGGLALFLFGMRNLTNSLKTVAGGRMRLILGKLTTNRFTGAYLFERDMMSKEALEERIAFNLETIMRMVCISP